MVFQPYKHWHSQALDVLIRDGIEEINKHQFLQVINEVRLKALKELTIKLAFRKTGIWPFEPSVITTQIKELHPHDQNREVTPMQSQSDDESRSSQLFSSPFRTPQNQRQFNVAGRYALNSVEKAIEGDDAAGRVRYHVKALAQSAEALAVEYTQLKERLNAVELTQRISRKYKDERRRHLQHGGVLKVSNARKMVKKKEEQEEERLRKKLARLKKKRQAEERITTNN